MCRVGRPDSCRPCGTAYSPKQNMRIHTTTTTTTAVVVTGSNNSIAGAAAASANDIAFKIAHNIPNRGRHTLREKTQLGVGGLSFTCQDLHPQTHTQTLGTCTN